MIKRYHEAPVAIFEQVQCVTDGDYALVHLFESNDAYFQKFKQAVVKGRDVLLDNSIFELGQAFDGNKYTQWIEELQPTWYIVPDSWKNGNQTVQMFNDFTSKYSHLPGKRIGVAQGSSYDEVSKTYHALKDKCDMIAFNLDFAEYADVPEVGIPYCLRMSIGRFRMLCDLYYKGVIDTQKPHHLLGCGVPQEATWYPKQWKWIRSIDTCNPVIHGMQGIVYDTKLPGLLQKSSAKMCEHIDDEVSDNALSDVLTNIQTMKQFCV